MGKARLCLKKTVSIGFHDLHCVHLVNCLPQYGLHKLDWQLIRLHKFWIRFGDFGFICLWKLWLQLTWKISNRCNQQIMQIFYFLSDPDLYSAKNRSDKKITLFFNIVRAVSEAGAIKSPKIWAGPLKNHFIFFRLPISRSYFRFHSTYAHLFLSDQLT